jgi:hypothetical protein
MTIILALLLRMYKNSIQDEIILQLQRILLSPLFLLYVLLRHFLPFPMPRMNGTELLYRNIPDLTLPCRFFRT